MTDLGQSQAPHLPSAELQVAQPGVGFDSKPLEGARYLEIRLAVPYRVSHTNVHSLLLPVFTNGLALTVEMIRTGHPS